MKVLKRFNKKIYCLSCVFEINSVLLQTEISSKIVKGGFTVLLESEFLELILMRKICIYIASYLYNIFPLEKLIKQ